MITPPPKSTIAGWQKSLNKSGSRNIKIRRLLKAYGVSKRGTKIIQDIQNHLKQQRPRIYARELDDTTIPLDTSIVLTLKDTGLGGRSYPAALRHKKRSDGKDSVTLTKGEEGEFKARYLAALLKELGLKKARLIGKGVSAVEFSPRGTRDKLDVVCEDRVSHDLVALEFKVRDGDRRGVEQLLRYAKQLSVTKANDPRLDHYKDAKVRGVLVTGIADQPTREAIATLDPYELVHWYTYSMKRSPIRLDSVKARHTKRHAPVRALEIRRVGDVNATTLDNDTVQIEFRKFRVELSRKAAIKLREQLKNIKP